MYPYIGRVTYEGEGLNFERTTFVMVA